LIYDEPGNQTTEQRLALFSKLKLIYWQGLCRGIEERLPEHGKRVPLEANVFEAEDICLVEGTKVLHNIHGPGEVLAINRDELQGTGPVYLQFENGVRCYSLKSAAKLLKVVGRSSQVTSSATSRLQVPKLALDHGVPIVDTDYIAVTSDSSKVPEFKKNLKLATEIACSGKHPALEVQTASLRTGSAVGVAFMGENALKQARCGALSEQARKYAIKGATPASTWKAAFESSSNGGAQQNESIPPKLTVRSSLLIASATSRQARLLALVQEDRHVRHFRLIKCAASFCSLILPMYELFILQGAFAVESPFIAAVPTAESEKQCRCRFRVRYCPRPAAR
jgi:hypothetical protein